MITNFNDWFNQFGSDSTIEEIDDLYNAVYQGSGNFGLFTVVSLKGNQQGFIVKSNSYKELGILSNNAQKEFLRELEDRYCDGMIEPCWYSYKKAEKND